MRIGLIGGLDRNQHHYQRAGAAAGHEIVFHTGFMGGRGAPLLEALVERCDLVVIVTDVNSHSAVQVARRALRRLGRTPLLFRKLGAARFEALLASVTVGGECASSPSR